MISSGRFVGPILKPLRVFGQSLSGVCLKEIVDYQQAIEEQVGRHRMV